MNLKNLIIYFVLFCSFLFAFGEQPFKPGNIAGQARIISPEKDELKNVLDGNINEQIKFSNILIDLGKLQYADSIEIFQPKNIAGIKISQDIVNWSELIPPSANTAAKQTYYLAGRDVRYLKLAAADEGQMSCTEIAIYPYQDYVLKFEYISASPDVKSCTIHVKTSISTMTQTIYGYNYDFIYNKKLEFSISTLAPGREHFITITDLLPETTYRYQVKITDFNGKILESNFFTFTTKSQTIE